MEKIKHFLTRNLWGQALLVLLGWNLVIRLVAIVGYFLLPARFAPLDFIAPFFKANYLFWSFANFDGEHYLSIAKYGYQFRGGFPQYAFFPLLPSLIKLVSFLVRDFYLAGMLVSQTALYLAIVFLRKWQNELHLPDITRNLLLSSGAIFLASIYTEPVFLALASMTMFFAEKKWWGRASVAVGLATATRVNGIFLLAFLILKMIQAKLNLKKTLLSLPLMMAGIISYMTFLFLKTGDALAWYHAQGAWGKATATSPLTTAVSYLKAITTEFIPDFTHLVVILEVMTTVFALYLFINLLRRNMLDYAYWVYLGGNLAMPIMTGSLGSMPRFFLILFPLLIVIPKLSRFERMLYYSYSLVACLIGILFFSRGYWYG